MTKAHVLTAHVDAEMIGRLDALADRLDQPREWIVEQAVARYVDEEAAFLAFIQEGDDALDRGDWITHEEFVAKLQDFKTKLQSKI